MGAFLAVYLINEATRKALGYGLRGSVWAFVISLVITIPLASWGFADGDITSLQVLPWVALGYGKFSVAFLIVDLYNARRLQQDPSSLRVRGRFGFPPSEAWYPAAIVILAGGLASYMLPQRSAATRNNNSLSEPASADWQSLASPDGLFLAKFPVTPEADSALQPNPTGRPPLTVRSFTAATSTAYYSLQCLTFSDAHIDPSATVERVLESTRDGMIASMSQQAGRLQGSRYSLHQDWPALEVSFQGTEGGETIRGRSRIVLVGRSLYTLLAVAAPDSDATRFFDSFQVLRAFDERRLPRRRE